MSTYTTQSVDSADHSEALAASRSTNKQTSMQTNNIDCHNLTIKLFRATRGYAGGSRWPASASCRCHPPTDLTTTPPLPHVTPPPQHGATHRACRGTKRRPKQPVGSPALGGFGPAGRAAPRGPWTASYTYITARTHTRTTITQRCVLLTIPTITTTPRLTRRCELLLYVVPTITRYRMRRTTARPLLT